MTDRHPDVRGAASLSGMHWAAVALVSLTGGIHRYVGWARARPSQALAGRGFFAGIVLFFAGYRRRVLDALGIGYVGVQVVLWAVFNTGEYTLIGYVDKAVQVVLLGGARDVATVGLSLERAPVPDGAWRYLLRPLAGRRL